MIAQLTGTLVHVGASACVIDVAGVGYHVLSTPSTLAGLRTGQSSTLATQLVVREDSLTMYGFASHGERDTFASLQAVQGVGPRLALALLSVHSPESLASAVAHGDRAALERVPGVGAKLAARLLLELGGKLVAPESLNVSGDAREQVVEALVGLGWNARAAQSAVTEVADQPIHSGEVSDTLRAALLVLGGARG